MDEDANKNRCEINGRICIEMIVSQHYKIKKAETPLLQSEDSNPS